MVQEQKDKIIEIIRNNTKFNDAEVSEETILANDLDMDDLDVVIVVMEIEDEFELFLECSDVFEEIKTVGDIFKKFEEAE